MKILGASRKYLLYMGLASERHLPIANFRVSRALVRCTIIGSQLALATIFAVNITREWERGLYAVVFPLHLFLLISSKLCIYTVLAVKTDRIAELIDYLQHVVDARKFVAAAVAVWTFDDFSNFKRSWIFA